MMTLQQRCEYLLGITHKSAKVYMDDIDGGSETPGYTTPGIYQFYDNPDGSTSHCRRLSDEMEMDHVECLNGLDHRGRKYIYDTLVATHTVRGRDKSA